MKNKRLLMFALLMGAISTAHGAGEFDGPYIGLSYGTAKGDVSEGHGGWDYSIDPATHYPSSGKDSDFSSAAISINAGYNFSLPHNNVIGIELDNLFGGTASGKQKVDIYTSVLTVGVNYHF